MILKWKTEILRAQPVTVPIFPPWISHGLNTGLGGKRRNHGTVWLQQDVSLVCCLLWLKKSTNYRHHYQYGMTRVINDLFFLTFRQYPEIYLQAPSKTRETSREDRFQSETPTRNFLNTKQSTSHYAPTFVTKAETKSFSLSRDIVPLFIWTIFCYKQHPTHPQIKCRLNSRNASYHSVPKLLSSHLLPRDMKIKTDKAIMLPFVLHWCKASSLN